MSGDLDEALTRAPWWLVLSRAQQHLADLEADWFSGKPVADQVRAAYEELRAAERTVLEGRT